MCENDVAEFSKSHTNCDTSWARTNNSTINCPKHSFGSRRNDKSLDSYNILTKPKLGSVGNFLNSYRPLQCLQYHTKM